MFFKAKPNGLSFRFLCGLYGGSDYLIVIRFDAPSHEKSFNDFRGWALNFFEGLYSEIPTQAIAGAFVGTPEELKKEIAKELK